MLCQAKPEGTHFLVPWLQRAILYDCRIKPRVSTTLLACAHMTTPVPQNISTTTGSKDLQMVSITLRVLSRPDVEHLPKIYQSLGLDYDERVLPSIGNEVLKSIVAQFDAAELITQREVVNAAATITFQCSIDLVPGLFSYTRRFAPASGRVQHQAGRRLNHPLDVREGQCYAWKIKGRS